MKKTKIFVVSILMLAAGVTAYGGDVEDARGVLDQFVSAINKGDFKSAVALASEDGKAYGYLGALQVNDVLKAYPGLKMMGLTPLSPKGLSQEDYVLKMADKVADFVEIEIGEPSGFEQVTKTKYRASVITNTALFSFLHFMDHGMIWVVKEQGAWRACYMPENAVKLPGRDEL